MSLRNTSALKAAQAEIERIAAENDGRITAEEVLARAEDPNNPLHRMFEWDDARAAHQHRLETARGLIRSCVVRTQQREVIPRIPAYVRDPGRSRDEQGYIAVKTVRTNEDMAREVLVAEFGRVASHLTRARGYATYLGLVDEVDSIAAEVGAILDRVSDAAAGTH